MSSDPSRSRIHPSDLPEARVAFLLASVLRIVASPLILVALALALWLLSDNVVTPLVGPLVGLTTVAYVEQRFRADAWAHIPRSRQATAAPIPRSWRIAARCGEFAAISTASLTFVMQIPYGSIAPDTASLAAGAILGGLLASLLLPPWESSGRRYSRGDTISMLPVVVVLVVALAGLAGQTTLDVALAAVATGVVIAATVVWTLMRLIPRHLRCVPRSFPLF